LASTIFNATYLWTHISMSQAASQEQGQQPDLQAYYDSLKALYLKHKEQLEYIRAGQNIVCFAKFVQGEQALYLLVVRSGDSGDFGDVAFFSGDTKPNLGAALQDAAVRKPTLPKWIEGEMMHWEFPVIETTWA